MALESLSSSQFNKFVQFAARQVEAGRQKAIARLSTEDMLGGRAAIYNQFPKEFRLDYDNINCYTGFQATIN